MVGFSVGGLQGFGVGLEPEVPIPSGLPRVASTLDATGQGLSKPRTRIIDPAHNATQSQQVVIRSASRIYGVRGSPYLR